MCVACIEYLKDHLTSDEFRSALRETTVEDEAHRREVERLMRELAGQPDELKRKLQELNHSRK